MIRCLNCGRDNLDDAKVCANCGFTLDWDPEPKPEPKPTTGPAKEIVLELSPSPARVKAGGQVALRVEGALPGGLESASWTATGEAAGMVTVTGAVSAEVRVPATATPGPRTFELLATGESTPPARAVGRLEVLAPDSIKKPKPDDGGGPSPFVVVAAVVAGVLVLLVLVGVIARIAAPKTGVTILAARGVCLHTSADTDDSTRIPLPGGGCEGPDRGEVVDVHCTEHGVFQLSGGDRWMTTSPSFVQPHGEIGACRSFPLSLLLGARRAYELRGS